MTRFGETGLSAFGFATLALGYPLLGVSSALGMLALATLIPPPDLATRSCASS